MLKKWSRIFKPENYKTAICETDIPLFVVKRVNPCAVPNFKPMKEPICIKSWYVGAPTSRNNERSLSLGHLTVFKRNGCHRPAHRNPVIFYDVCVRIDKSFKKGKLDFFISY